MNIQADFVKGFFEQNQDLAFGLVTSCGRFTVISFEAQEAVNSLFEIRLDLASEDSDIDLHALIDSQATLFIRSKYDAVPRYFTGIVVSAERRDSGIRRTLYSLILCPPLYRLAQTSDCRIWQGKTVPEIATELLAEQGISNVTWRLGEDHAPREFLCQFNETTLAFLTRILSEEGIFWFFAHHAESVEMVITDAPHSTPILPQARLVSYNANPGGQTRGFWINRFVQREKLCSTAYELNDYNFKNPPARMNEPWRLQENNGAKREYQLYDYPGRYKNPSKVGKNFVKHRMQATRVEATTGYGLTNHIHLMPGYHFTLCDHDDEKANIQHFLLSVTSKGQQPAALEEDAPEDAATTFEAEFSTMPGRLPYRPPVPLKPVVDGPQIAMVVGPEGEEIYTDEFGRVRVFFYWDRHGKKDETASCWVRVAQNWAGGTWGQMAIPRIGQEVIVAHLDGDIDQPIIIGRTYHATNRPPYKLPENKTRMTIKSQTHKGQGFNELRFEDEAGKEEVFIHAQRDQNVEVENDYTMYVGHNKAERIEANYLNETQLSRYEKTGRSHHSEIQGDRIDLIGGIASLNLFASSIGKRSQKIWDLFSKLPKLGGVGNWISFVTGYRISTTVLDDTEKVGGSKTINTGAHCNISSSASVSVSACENIIVDADESLIIRCGDSAIVLKKDGRIAISGTKLLLSTGETEIEAEKTVSIKAAKIKLN